nr:coproporphyrinogen III oxidase [Clostridium guangxiense]
MIKIKLNNDLYSYDVYHISNLFFDSIELIDSNDWNYSVRVEENSVYITSSEKVESYKFDKELKDKSNVKIAVFKYFTKLTGKMLPWGTLIGIRPSKIALNLMEEKKTDKEIINYFKHHSLTKENKTKLCIEVAKREKKIVNDDVRTVSIYIGMPFCPTRCLYCSFISDTIANCRGLVDGYLEAMIYEIEKTADFIHKKGLTIESIYFGGGTPTSVDNNQFEYVMKSIYDNLLKTKVKEFTVECGRPDSITYEKLISMKRYGVNRISINPQTMNDDTLKLIGRNHSAKDVIDKFNLSRKVGFDNINMDIIIGLPGENTLKVKNTCSEIIKLRPESITVHGLALKRGSKMFENVLNNVKMKLPDQNELNDMHDTTLDCAYTLNMKPYYMYRQKNMVGNLENVGYSIDGKECIYNVEMIEDKQTIIAIGSNGVSKIIFRDTNRIERYGNLKDVREYTRRIEEKVDGKIKFLETLYKASSKK